MICFFTILGSLWHFGPLDPSILGPQMVRGLQPEYTLGAFYPVTKKGGNYGQTYGGTDVR